MTASSLAINHLWRRAGLLGLSFVARSSPLTGKITCRSLSGLVHGPEEGVDSHLNLNSPVSLVTGETKGSDPLNSSNNPNRFEPPD